MGSFPGESNMADHVPKGKSWYEVERMIDILAERVELERFSMNLKFRQRNSG